MALDTGQAMRESHLGAELEKLEKTVCEVSAALGLPNAELKEAMPKSPNLAGVLEGHIESVRQLQSAMARISSEVGALHSSLA